MREMPKDYMPLNRQDIAVPSYPTQLPNVPEGYLLMCEYVRAPDMPSLNKHYVCESFDDMRELDASCAAGGAILLNWYITPELAKVTRLGIVLSEG